MLLNSMEKFDASSVHSTKIQPCTSVIAVQVGIGIAAEDITPSQPAEAVSKLSQDRQKVAIACPKAMAPVPSRAAAVRSVTSPPFQAPCFEVYLLRTLYGAIAPTSP